MVKDYCRVRYSIDDYTESTVLTDDCFELDAVMNLLCTVFLAMYIVVGPSN